MPRLRISFNEQALFVLFCLGGTDLTLSDTFPYYERHLQGSNIRLSEQLQGQLPEAELCERQQLQRLTIQPQINGQRDKSGQAIERGRNPESMPSPCGGP